MFTIRALGTIPEQKKTKKKCSRLENISQNRQEEPGPHFIQKQGQNIAKKYSQSEKKDGREQDSPLLMGSFLRAGEDPFI